jgi:hypothetical protein
MGVRLPVEVMSGVVGVLIGLEGVLLERPIDEIETQAYKLEPWETWRMH